jgi:hypothetical protein
MDQQKSGNPVASLENGANDKCLYQWGRFFLTSKKNVFEKCLARASKPTNRWLKKKTNFRSYLMVAFNIRCT